MHVKFTNLVFFLLLLSFTGVKAQSVVEWELADEPSGISQSGFQKVITKARNHFLSYPNDTIIVKVAAGTYNIGGNGSHGISLVGGMNPGPGGRLIFKGAGMDSTTLVFTDMGNNIIRANNLNRTEFREMHFTRDRNTTTQGTIVSVLPGQIILDIPAGFPTPADIMNINVDGGRYLKKFTNSATHPVRYYDSVTLQKIDQIAWGRISDSAYFPVWVGGNQWKVFLRSAGLDTRNPPYNFAVGNYLALTSKFDGNAFLINEGYDVAFIDVKWTRTARGVTKNVDKLRYIGCRIKKPAPINGQAFCFGFSAGGVQINQNNEPSIYDVIIEDYFAEGTGDDPFALYNVEGAKVKNVQIIGDSPIRVDTGARNTCIENLQMADSASISFLFPGGLKLNYSELTQAAVDEVNAVEANKVTNDCSDSMNANPTALYGANFINTSGQINCHIADGNLHIRSADALLNIAIIDMAGRIVWSSSVNKQNDIVIDVSSVHQGIYILRSQTSRETISKKIYIE